MKIGLDFDDVVFDFIGSLTKWHNEKYHRNDSVKDYKEFFWGPVWQTNREETIKRVDEFLESHRIQEVPPLSKAIESIKSLLKHNDITVITGRPPRFKEKTKDWISYHLNERLEVIIAGEFHKGQAESKAVICNKNNISLLIEDAPQTALDCANSDIIVLLFDKSWNQGIIHKNIIRVKDWNQIMYEIDKISLKTNILS